MGHYRRPEEDMTDSTAANFLMSAALYTRFRSRRDHTFAEKILSAMRKGFGAHVEPKDRKAKPS
jgi:6-phosphogluconate dehydrogenase (decarboxylating)